MPGIGNTELNETKFHLARCLESSEWDSLKTDLICTKMETQNRAQSFKEECWNRAGLVLSVKSFWIYRYWNMTQSGILNISWVGLWIKEMIIRLEKEEYLCVSVFLFLLSLFSFSAVKGSQENLYQKAPCLGFVIYYVYKELVMKLWKPHFPLLHVSQRSAWFLRSVLPQHKVWRDYESVICLWKLSFTSVSGYTY